MGNLVFGGCDFVVRTLFWYHHFLAGSFYATPHTGRDLGTVLCEDVQLDVECNTLISGSKEWGNVLCIKDGAAVLISWSWCRFRVECRAQVETGTRPYWIAYVALSIERSGTVWHHFCSSTMVVYTRARSSGHAVLWAYNKPLKDFDAQFVPEFCDSRC